MNMYEVYTYQDLAMKQTRANKTYKFVRDGLFEQVKSNQVVHSNLFEMYYRMMGITQRDAEEVVDNHVHNLVIEEFAKHLGEVYSSIDVSISCPEIYIIREVNSANKTKADDFIWYYTIAYADRSTQELTLLLEN